MYNYYSYDVKKIFKEAEKIAMEYKHSYVGTEHLLLSLIKCDDKIKALLKKYDLTYESFLKELLLIVPTKTEEFTGIYTPLLKRVIKISLDLCKNNLLEPIYLMEAILEEGEGLAIRIIISMGVDIDKLYDEVKAKNKKSSTKLELYKLGKDMSLIDNDDILVGRDKEISQVMETLLRKNKNNPLLIGDAGVGKSAIVEEIARRINKGRVPSKLRNKKIISLEMSSLVAGTKYRGEFEEKLQKVIKELENNPEIILFIDEIHTISNAGGAEGAINASDILKPYLARGTIKIIGATTINEYNKFIAKDKALARRFEIIKINEPNNLETEYILSKIKPSFEKHYNIKITNSNIKTIVSLTDRYILDRCNPDKSIDLLDSVCARKEVINSKDKEISILKEKLDNIIKEKEAMVGKNNFDEALKYRSMEIELQKKIEACKNSVCKISDSDIRRVLLRKNNIPFLNLNYDKLKMHLLDNIVGQDNPIASIIDALKEKDANLPVSILLTGSTGVGKTKTVKEIAAFLKIPLIRLDLNEYNESISVSRLIGTSAGYIGYDDENIFEKVRMNPCSIILLDELEKAHSCVINLFLQILDEGYVTNSKGEKIDFKNTFIFLTSNAKITSRIGFISSNSTYENTFSKEFLGRISCKIEFNNVTEDAMKLYLDKLNIKDYSIIKDFDYLHQGFRGLDKYIKSKKNMVR